MREQKVTREMVSTVAKVMVVDIATGKTFTEEVKLPKKQTDNDKILKQLQAKAPEGVRPVAVLESTIVKEMLGMLESDFLKYAKPLDEKRNFIGEEVTESKGE